VSTFINIAIYIYIYIYILCIRMVVILLILQHLFEFAKRTCCVTASIIRALSVNLTIVVALVILLITC